MSIYSLHAIFNFVSFISKLLTLSFMFHIYPLFNQHNVNCEQTCKQAIMNLTLFKFFILLSCESFLHVYLAAVHTRSFWSFYCRGSCSWFLVQFPFWIVCIISIRLGWRRFILWIVFLCLFGSFTLSWWLSIRLGIVLFFRRLSTTACFLLGLLQQLFFWRIKIWMDVK